MITIMLGCYVVIEGMKCSYIGRRSSVRVKKILVGRKGRQLGSKQGGGAFIKVEAVQECSGGEVLSMITIAKDNLIM